MLIFLRFLEGLTLLFVPLLRALAIFFPTLRKRDRFERQNMIGPGSQSWAWENEKAALCVHVSSEGEFEQVRELLMAFLERAERLEIIFTSPSVEKKILNFYQHYPQLIRYLRLPILTGVPFVTPHWPLQWVTSDVFVMVRYDFFPVLLLLAYTKRSYLLWATLKGKSMRGARCGYWRLIFHCFNDIVPASPYDEKRIISLLKERREIFPFMEMRSLSILRRQVDQRAELGVYGEKVRIWAQAFSRVIILGNFWPNELKIFDNRILMEDVIFGRVGIYIAPHKIDSSSLVKLQKAMENRGIDFQLVNSFDDTIGAKSLLVVAIPAILCESYTFFNYAFVGGGHGRSVHSLLEPFLAGCQVFCGPKTHRSTEYDLIESRNANRIHLINDLVYFYDLIKEVEHYLKTRRVKQSFEGESEAIFQEESEKFKRLVAHIGGNFCD